MGDRNLTPYPIIPGSLDAGKRRKNPPAIQKPVEQIVSSFTALNVESLTEELYEDSGLLIRGNVFQELYDPSIIDPEKNMVFEKKPTDDDIDTFDFKNLSYSEKKLLLKRLEEAEEKGLPKKESSAESTPTRPPKSSPQSSEDYRKKRRYIHKAKHTDKVPPKKRNRSRSPSFHRDKKYRSKPHHSKDRHYKHSPYRSKNRQRSRRS